MISAAAPITVPASVSPALTPVPSSFQAEDLARLRELIQATASQTANPLGVHPATPMPAGPTEAVQPGGLGDSILQGILRFGDGYQKSMSTIDTRLREVTQADSNGLANFGEILALQVDVARWSMSVMGVDNASKAGSNTIKELSRGG